MLREEVHARAERLRGLKIKFWSAQLASGKMTMEEVLADMDAFVRRWYPETHRHIHITAITHTEEVTDGESVPAADGPSPAEEAPRAHRIVRFLGVGTRAR